jgi:AcrR family transcriptional regulator
VSVEDVLDAVDAVGIERVTVADVAARLGVAHPALYRYFADRDEMVAAALHRRWEQLTWPRCDTGWPAYLEALAAQVWQQTASDPAIAQQIAAMRATTAVRCSPVRVIAPQVVTSLRGEGLATPVVTVALAALYDLTSVAFFVERSWALRASAAADPGADPLDVSRTHAFLPPVHEDVEPEISDVVDWVRETGQHAWFERGVRAMVETVAEADRAYRVAGSSASPSSSESSARNAVS